jgi:hypothetical protein
MPFDQLPVDIHRYCPTAKCFVFLAPKFSSSDLHAYCSLLGLKLKRAHRVHGMFAPLGKFAQAYGKLKKDALAVGIAVLMR